MCVFWSLGIFRKLFDLCLEEFKGKRFVDVGRMSRVGYELFIINGVVEVYVLLWLSGISGRFR